MNDHPGDKFPEGLGEPLRTAVERIANRPVPADSLRRALSRAELVDRGADRPRRRKAVMIVAGMAAAAVVVLWSWPPPPGWAQVAGALQSHSWVHGTAQYPNGTSQEFWFSAGRGVTASRYGDVVIYDDHRLGVRYTYHPQEHTLYRVLQDQEFSHHLFDALRDFFDELVGKDERVRSPLAGAEVVQQERRSVVLDGQTWAEYDLALRRVANDERLRVVFRVSSGSLLPRSMRLIPLGQPTNPPLEFTFEYPESGPLDVYALGVPRDATFVDRVPPEDLATVLKGMRIGRQRFGPYHAIAVTPSGDAPAWQSRFVRLVWRKGNRWRIETDDRNFAPAPATAPPPGTDMLAWWQERCKQFRFLPNSVCDGRAVYRPQVFPSYHHEASQNYRKWDEQRRVAAGDDDAWSGGFDRDFLEHLAYRYLAMPSQWYVVELDRAPKEGPSGTLLLTGRVTGSAEYALLRHRCWVDPQRSYATLRYELDGGPNAAKSIDIMDRLEQSPTGVWYPTMVRTERIAPAPKPGEPPQQSSGAVTWYYVDFKAELPDRLFEPRLRDP